MERNPWSLEVFYIEDENLLDGLLKFENRDELEPEEPKTVPDWKKYSNVSRIDPEELTIELLEKLNGAPVSDQTWLLNQKPRIKKLKRLLTELKENGILIERKSKQDFHGIKEIGYDIIE